LELPASEGVLWNNIYMLYTLYENLDLLTLAVFLIPAEVTEKGERSLKKHLSFQTVLVFFQEVKWAIRIWVMHVHGFLTLYQEFIYDGNQNTQHLCEE